MARFKNYKVVYRARFAPDFLYRTRWMVGDCCGVLRPSRPFQWKRLDGRTDGEAPHRVKTAGLMYRLLKAKQIKATKEETVLHKMTIQEIQTNYYDQI